jgi:flagellar P-ring protein FlgI
MKPIVCVFLGFVLASSVQAESRAGVEIKDLTTLEGARDNQLIGYGIVVGLAGTGDRRQTVFSTQSLTNLLERMGVSVSPTAIRVNNTASVIITATLPPFAQTGSRIDVTVASVGDALNLQGGLLLLTPLRAADGAVYAVSQGAVVIRGFGADRGGNSQQVNHPTVGRVANGALIERAAPTLAPEGTFRLHLKRADFTTAARITEAINKNLGAGAVPWAQVENAVVVAVHSPEAYAHRPIEFMAQLESVTVDTDQPAKIVVNERTGTIVMGKDVRIAPVAIMHGNLTVEIKTAIEVSQPPALSIGQTQVVPQTSIAAKEEQTRNIVLNQGASVEELVRALAAIQSTPREVIAILQNLKAAGALEADLEII